MTTLFVRPTVSDYAAWRNAYHAFASVQQANVVVAQAVYQGADNQNEMTWRTTLRRLRRLGFSPSQKSLGRRCKAVRAGDTESLVYPKNLTPPQVAFED
jgi:hypothetical protein